MTRGLVAAPLGQVTVLSLMKVTAVLRGPQYPITSTSVWLHSPLHAAPVQSRRTTRVAFSAVPGGPGGPAGPGGSTLTRGALGGGGVPGGALHVTFCPSGGQNRRRDVLRLSAAPAPSPGRTTVAPSHLA